MIKHLLTIVWNQRKQNSWIFIELSLVFIALWTILDGFVVEKYLYQQPLGFNAENCWKLSFEHYTPDAPQYVNDTTQQFTDGQALEIILDRLHQINEIESSCIAFYSSPYSQGNTWLGIMPIGKDSLKYADKSFHRYRVSPEFFEVFKVKGRDGKSNLTQLTKEHVGSILVTPDLEKQLYGEENAIGREVHLMSDSPGQNTKIFGVTTPIRMNEFSTSEPALFTIMHPQEVEQEATSGGANNLEVSIRMKKPYTEEEMNRLISGMSEQLSVGNLYVDGASSWTANRDRMFKDRFDKMNTKLLLIAFILFNVFFGVIGTFWLRTEQRHSETGLRLAMGSTKRQIGWFFSGEGCLLLFAVIPLVSLVIINMAYMEIMSTKVLPLTWWRLLIGFIGTLALMGVMIGIGTWIPARKAMKQEPAEALHYE